MRVTAFFTFLLRLRLFFGRTNTAFGVAILATGIAGCGLKGPLYLPEDYPHPKYPKTINTLLDSSAEALQDALDRTSSHDTVDSDASADLPGDSAGGH